MELRYKTYVRSWISGRFSQVGKGNLLFPDMESLLSYVEKLKHSSWHLQDDHKTTISINGSKFVNLYE